MHDALLSWKVNTIGLLKEIQNNAGTGALRIPLQIFADLLAEVADRAIELNDPKMNALMCKLALYEQSDPYSKDYNQELVNKTIIEGYEQYRRVEAGTAGDSKNSVDSSRKKGNNSSRYRSR